MPHPTPSQCTTNGPLQPSGTPALYIFIFIYLDEKLSKYPLIDNSMEIQKIQLGMNEVECKTEDIVINGLFFFQGCLDFHSIFI